MSIITPILAIFNGFRLCFFDAAIRKLAVWPWLLGFVFYILCGVGAYHAHGPLLTQLINSPERWWSYILYYLAWLILALMLAVSMTLATWVFVMIFTGVFQESIAEQILKREGLPVYELKLNLKDISKEILRSVRTESVKLLWLAPLFLIAFILGFIPILIPIGFLITAWLLGYQNVDVVLNVLRVKTGKRFSFAKSHAGVLTVFGSVLTVVMLVPLVGVFLPPVAVAGASWLVSQEGLKLEIERLVDKE